MGQTFSRVLLYHSEKFSIVYDIHCCGYCEKDQDQSGYRSNSSPRLAYVYKTKHIRTAISQRCKHDSNEITGLINTLLDLILVKNYTLSEIPVLMSDTFHLAHNLLMLYRDIYINKKWLSQFVTHHLVSVIENCGDNMDIKMLECETLMEVLSLLLSSRRPIDSLHCVCNLLHELETKLQISSLVLHVSQISNKIFVFPKHVNKFQPNCCDRIAASSRHVDREADPNAADIRLDKYDTRIEHPLHTSDNDSNDSQSNLKPKVISLDKTKSKESATLLPVNPDEDCFASEHTNENDINGFVSTVRNTLDGSIHYKKGRKLDSSAVATEIDALMEQKKLTQSETSPTHLTVIHEDSHVEGIHLQNSQYESLKDLTSFDNDSDSTTIQENEIAAVEIVTASTDTKSANRGKIIQLDQCGVEANYSANSTNTADAIVVTDNYLATVHSTYCCSQKSNVSNDSGSFESAIVKDNTEDENNSCNYHDHDSCAQNCCKEKFQLHHLSNDQISLLCSKFLRSEYVNNKTDMRMKRLKNKDVANFENEAWDNEMISNASGLKEECGNMVPHEVSECTMERTENDPKEKSELNKQSRSAERSALNVGFDGAGGQTDSQSTNVPWEIKMKDTTEVKYVYKASSHTVSIQEVEEGLPQDIRTMDKGGIEMSDYLHRTTEHKQIGKDELKLPSQSASSEDLDDKVDCILGRGFLGKGFALPYWIKTLNGNVSVYPVTGQQQVQGNLEQPRISAIARPETLNQLMTRELLRLCSYSNSQLPINSNTWAIILAQSGFYCLTREGDVRCFSCGREYPGFLIGTPPENAHDRRCRHHQENIPLSAMTQGLSSGELDQYFILYEDPATLFDREQMGGGERYQSSAHEYRDNTSLLSTTARSQSSGYATGHSGATLAEHPLSLGHEEADSSFAEVPHNREEENDNRAHSEPLSATSNRPRHGSLPPDLNDLSGAIVSQESQREDSMQVYTSAASRPIDLNIAQPPPPADNGGDRAEGGAVGGHDPTTGQVNDLRRASYPQFASQQSRLASFRAWSADHSHRPEDLAAAGFFYAGYADCVRCFYCGVGLKYWRETDIPAYQHARFRPHCVYNILYKGQEYIDRVQEDVRQQGQAGGPEQGVGGIAPQAGLHQAPTEPEVPETGPMASAAAVAALGDGWSRDQVQRAVNHIMEELGENCLQPDILADVLNNLQMEPFDLQEPDPNRADALSLSDEEEPLEGNDIRFRDDEPQVSQTVPQRREQTGAGDSAAQGAQAHIQQPAPAQLNPEEEMRVVEREHNYLMQRTTCSICHAQPVSCVFLPCGHVTACEPCADAAERCNLCNKSIIGTANIYLA